MVLSITDKARIVALLEDGHNKSYVSRTLGFPRSTVRDTWDRYIERGNFSRRRGSGRPRITTVADDRFLLIRSLRDRRTNSVSLKNDLQMVRRVRISEDTVRRRLNEAGLRSRRPAKTQRLLRRHRRDRLRFARLHVNWTVEQWSNVLFTDESRVCLWSPDGRERVYRRPNERFAECTITERISYQGGSVMVWAGISNAARTDLVFVDNGAMNAHRYIEDVLGEHVIPFAPLIGENFILMQDNARPHVAHVVTQYLEEVGVRTLDWPACSPDMNPIEHMWDQLKRAVRRRPRQPSTLQELKIALTEEYLNIPQERITHLIHSMPRRIRGLIAARGGHTRY